MNKLVSYSLPACLLLLLLANQKDAHGQAAFTRYSGIAALESRVNTLAALPPGQGRSEAFKLLYDTLRTTGRIPFCMDTTALFFYCGKAKSISWAGDFSGWNPGLEEFKGLSPDGDVFWWMKHHFPADARLDYKIVIDGSEWVSDAGNPHMQVSGFGANSELRMPAYRVPWETIADNKISHGSLCSEQILRSSKSRLGYDLQYRVYLPAGYDTLSRLPVVYVTDGHEYADETKGAMVNVLDNMIAKGFIKPVMAVFIDPREPGNLSNSRRMQQYTGNSRFVDCICDELLPYIDSIYKTSPLPGARMILGTSLGGWNSAIFGIQRPGVFGLIAIHSPAFDAKIIKQYADAPLLPLKVFMSTGVIHDTEKQARAMRDVLEKKGYPLKYQEVNQGHSWGNWKGLIDEPLVWFFPVEK